MSELFHVTNVDRQRGSLSTYLFAVCLDELSIELNNIEVGCHIGEVVLNEPLDVC